MPKEAIGIRIVNTFCQWLVMPLVLEMFGDFQVDYKTTVNQ